MTCNQLLKNPSSSSILESSDEAEESSIAFIEIIRHMYRLSGARNKLSHLLGVLNSIVSRTTYIYALLPETPKAIRLVVLLPSMSGSADTECILCNESLRTVHNTTHSLVSGEVQQIHEL